MKNLLLLFIAVCGLSVAAFAQSDKYVSSMKANLALFDSTNGKPDYVALSNTFARIGDAEKTQWLPYYYAGLALSTEGWNNKTLDKDANSGQILAFMDKAQALTTDSSDLSEINAVRNMAYVQQMLVDPATRFMSYGKEASKALATAMALDPNNPRPYYLEGMSLFNKPAIFGGGKAKAKVSFQKALDLYATDQPKELHPNWGKVQTVSMIAACQ
jgi:hypothetical protein